MDNEKTYELAFNIIVHAGESRSLSSEAMDAAENYDFDKAEDLLKQANDQFLKCHWHVNKRSKWRKKRNKYHPNSRPRPFNHGNNGHGQCKKASRII